MSSVKKVGIPAQVFMAWPGGVDLITHLANAMALNHKLKLFFLVPDSAQHLEVRLEKDQEIKLSSRDLGNHLLLRIKKPEQMQVPVQELKKGLNKKIKIVYYKNTPEGFLASIKALGLDALIPTTASFGPGFPIPWVGYIWDFQHKYYPDFFSREELVARDKIFKRTLNEAPSVVVNSEEVKKDASRFYKFPRDKVVVLPFAPEPDEEWFEVNLSSVKRKYKLPDKYLLISNQFWLHKSHLTAIEAIAQLLKDNRYKDIHLICTGKMEEPRRPKYIKQITDRVTKLGIDKNVHFLGYIPKLDQIGIMRQALSVIQPTTYEGGRGGGAANNAIALGIPLIVSNIAINKELVGPNINFFKAGSALDLVRTIKHLLNSSPKSQAKRQLIAQGRVNKNKLSKSLTLSLTLAEKNFNKMAASSK